MFCSSIGSSKRYRLWTWQALAGSVLDRVLFHWACPHGRESFPLGPAVFASRNGQSGAWSPFAVGFTPPMCEWERHGSGDRPHPVHPHLPEWVPGSLSYPSQDPELVFEIGSGRNVYRQHGWGLGCAFPAEEILCPAALGRTRWFAGACEVPNGDSVIYRGKFAHGQTMAHRLSRKRLVLSRLGGLLSVIPDIRSWRVMVVDALRSEAPDFQKNEATSCHPVNCLRQFATAHGSGDFRPD